MPTIHENISVWDHSYDWTSAGEEWSIEWGGSYMQWHGTILPRIRAFLPAHTILEISPGFGRWTDFLKDNCTNLIVVDLAEKCIKACKERFATCSHITYFVNDGESLDMIPDNAIDLIFSFDSLVHVEDKVMSAYISQFPRKLKQNGVAFIHHSNLGEYSNYFKMLLKISRFPRLLGILIRYGVLDNVLIQGRDASMTARKMRIYAEENGLQCISQELINWNSKHALIDCMSIVVQKGSIWSRDNRVLRNDSFMREAKNLSNLSRLYDLQMYNRS